MNDFKKEYMKRVIEDRKVTEQMVADGEITVEEGCIRNDFRKEEILIEMSDDVRDDTYWNEMVKAY